MMRRRIPLALGLLAALAQCWALYSPGSPEPRFSIPVPGADKIVHVLLFAVPVALLLHARVLRRIVLPIALLQIVVSEIVQELWIPYRGGELGDALADLVGIGLGVLGAACGTRGWGHARATRRGRSPVRAP
ncbi:hypothetical protein [Granulicoccus sp. GXG6511]|uniref:hypothetical protein n=1 Tax=Granulicoccus sp. GXG6511 TaxID=3381351 RepID=UPI003D7EB61C